MSVGVGRGKRGGRVGTGTNYLRYTVTFQCVGVVLTEIALCDEGGGSEWEREVRR